MFELICLKTKLSILLDIQVNGIFFAPSVPVELFDQQLICQELIACHIQ